MTFIIRAVFLFVLFLFFLHGEGISQEITLYSFEEGPQGWTMPDWAISDEGNMIEEISVSEFFASEGKRSFELKINFSQEPGWKGAYIECPIGVTDWSLYSWLSVDVFMPEDAPRDISARIILTVGKDWEWTESNKDVRLIPGEWTVVRVNLLADSMDWRRFITEEFRKDVKKIGLRIEANDLGYSGSIYLDNVKLTND